MREFWVSSGHHLTRRAEGGGLQATDELLLAYLARPELIPPEEACDAERRLHAALLAEPRRPVPAEELAALSDPDARENWALMLDLRRRLMERPTLEAVYLDLAREGGGVPLLMGQLVHLILRNALEGCPDPFILRAAELFFRPQRVSFHEGRVLLADAELVEGFEGGRAASPLVAMLGKDPHTQLDVMDDANAWTYWSRSDAHTMVLDLASPRPREALARAVELWLAHLLDLEARIEPVARIEDRDWRWFIGLDAEATRIGNRLWRGERVDAEAMARVLALFRMTVPDRARLDPQVAGHPIYLLLAMDTAKTVRVKPQNLIAGLPLRAPAPAE